MSDTDSRAAPESSTESSQRDLEPHVEELAAENQRLRAAYAESQRTRYRRVALGLAALGIVGVVAALAFPASRPVLLILGAIGLFGGLLTYYLTPEQFVPATVGERVYTALADTGIDIVADLGLTDARVYVPTPAVSGPARLFVPQRATYTIPESEALTQPFVVTGDDATQGLATHPTGGPLFTEFQRGLTGSLGTTPAALAAQLTDALVEQFELVDATEVAVESDRISVGITGSAYGPVDRFDHPVVSLLAVGVACGLEQPVTATVSGGDDRFEYTVTLRPHDGTWPAVDDQEEE